MATLRYVIAFDFADDWTATTSVTWTLLCLGVYQPFGN